MHTFWIALWVFMTYPKAMHDSVAAGLLQLWVIEVTQGLYREGKAFLYDPF